MTTLTYNFSRAELEHSDTAVRLGIDNTASDRIITALFVLAVGLEKVRALLNFPVRVSSGYRCEELERVLCDKDYRAWCARHGNHVGADSWNAYFLRKAHPNGYAADFTAAGFGDPLSIVKAIEASDIGFDQCIQEGKWVHISFAPAMRREVLTATFTAGTAIYTKGA
jgi:putative chitinase